MTERVFHQEAEFRSLDEEKRQASYVASTEKPVSVGWGAPEVLRMTGCRLARFRKNPVVLDSHNRWGLESVIGRADVKIQGRELHCTITYANTEAGQRAWTLVKDDVVRAVSIGYSINPARVTRLREGETDGEGEGMVEGPCNVVREWTLLEISNVPVPADEDAVRRGFYESLPEQEKPMGQIIDRAMAERGEPTPTPSNVAPPPAPKLVATQDELAEERAARTREAFRRSVLAITPRGLEADADKAILEGLDFDACRKRLLEAQAARFAPLGTPDAPKDEPKTNAEGQRGDKPLPAEITDDVLVRSFQSLTG